MNRLLVIMPDVSLANSIAPDFAACDRDGRLFRLQDLLGRRGLLLGFIGDVWLPTNAQRIHALQRVSPALQRVGVQPAMITSNEAHTLIGFYASSPVPFTFPLLADADRRIHLAYGVGRSDGILLINRDQRVRARWTLSDGILLPDYDDLLKATVFLN